jgi:hypothetical protein
MRSGCEHRRRNDPSDDEDNTQVPNHLVLNQPYADASRLVY